MVLAMFLAATFVACGGDDDDDEAREVPGGAKGRVVREADPICRDTRERLGGRLGQDPTQQQQIVRQAHDRLRNIQAPAEDVEEWQEFLNHFNNVAYGLEDAAQAGLVNDRPRADEAVAEAREAAARAASVADKYGFVECARPL